MNVVTVTPGLQDEHYGIPTSLHGQLGPVALFWESLSPQELIDIHTVGRFTAAVIIITRVTIVAGVTIATKVTIVTGVAE